MYGYYSEVMRDAIRQMNRYDQLFYELKKEHLLNFLEDGDKSGTSDFTIFDIMDQEKKV